MKKHLWIVFFSWFILPACDAQELPQTTEQQLENLSADNDTETEDDSFLQQLEQFRRNPVDLNTTDEAGLEELKIITDLQIQSFISYRRLFGKLIDICELQAVPAWDIITIRKLLPFITISSPIPVKDDLSHRTRAGEHSLLFRISQIMERSKGFGRSDNTTKFLGSPQRMFFRYRYAYKNLLQWGITGDKDAGEQFFKGAQKKGFDFYSFHLFARNIGIIGALAIGDFTVNMGQGLVQWQSLAFKKSADVIAIKRQSQVLHPYNSAGEYNFFRGAGITVKKGRLETTAFVSMRNLSANLNSDSSGHGEFISSFLTSGYNRTADEISEKNSVRQGSVGAVISYNSKPFRQSHSAKTMGTGSWHMAVNSIYYHFSRPVQKANDPYNLYAINGDNWYNFSIDYSCTYNNFHFFGEAAADKNYNKAFVDGLLVSVDPGVDLSLLYRNINKGYQSAGGNAFTENTVPSNERGFYMGLSLHPGTSWRLDAYGDIYSFPWLKYRVDAPGYGKDFLVQWVYTPSKKVEIYTRFRSENKQGNQASSGRETGMVTNYLVELPKQNWRVQVSYTISPDLTLRNREEMVWYDTRSNEAEKGFLSFLDIAYKPLMSPGSAILRLQYFETDGYNSRIYAYENDVLYGYSIPVSYDKGYRYCITLNYAVTKKLSLWLRWAQTVFINKTGIGSGPDEIPGSKKSEIKMQVRYIFKSMR